MSFSDRASSTDHAGDMLALSGASPRQLRAQAVQRLQVGLFGLALMLVLVGLANIIMDHARSNEAAMAASSKAAVSSGGAGGTGGVNSDPLADIGVAPDAGKPHPARSPSR